MEIAEFSTESQRLALAFARCADDALRRLNERIDEVASDNPLHDLALNSVEVYMWTQTWGDTTGAFGGIGGQAITSGRTLVFIDEAYWIGGAVVYHSFGFVHHVKKPNGAFYEACAAHQLPGVVGGWKRFEEQDDIK